MFPVDFIVFLLKILLKIYRTYQVFLIFCRFLLCILPQFSFIAVAFIVSVVTRTCTYASQLPIESHISCCNIESLVEEQKLMAVLPENDAYTSFYSYSTHRSFTLFSGTSVHLVVVQLEISRRRRDSQSQICQTPSIKILQDDTQHIWNTGYLNLRSSVAKQYLRYYNILLPLELFESEWIHLFLLSIMIH